MNQGASRVSTEYRICSVSFNFDSLSFNGVCRF